MCDRPSAENREHSTGDPPAISYCLSNVSEETRRSLKQRGCLVIEDVCLQRCGQCFEQPFLLVGETLVTGHSHETIWQSIQVMLDAWRQP